MKRTTDLTKSSPHTSTAAAKRLQARQAREKRFRLYGLAESALGLTFVAILFVTIVSKGCTAFTQTMIALDLHLDPQVLGISDQNDPQSIGDGDFDALVKNASEAIPQVKGRRNLRTLGKLVSPGAGFEVRQQVLNKPSLLGTTARVWVPADDDVDMLIKGHMNRHLNASKRRIKAQPLAWFVRLNARGLTEQQFNRAFFTAGDSGEPELAGICGATVGSCYTMLITMGLAFPIGISTAVYLEEFATKNR